MTRRGELRVYLGSAPGVGKTYAMLDEGARRARRGTDVVVGYVETHGRVHTAEQIGSLEVVPRAVLDYRGARLEEMDLDAVLARQPEVVLVDELAHTNAPGSRNTKRWEDVETLLAAGIDVLSTVNVQHLESLNDVVAEITGVPQAESVPDAFVRRAEQVELVDMTPEALRRRMAHGNIYAPDKVDAALGNYFRPGNLTALRELSLLWLADRVEEGLRRYRAEHGITGTWETRERVVVALTGGAEGEALIRRAARIAARSSGGDLMAVHVQRSDGLSGGGVASLVGQRRLLESLGGTYHSVVGEDVPQALLSFARSVDATQIVLGVSRKGRLASALAGPGTGATVARLSGSIDVHLVTHPFAGAGLGIPPLGRGLTLRRRLTGAAVAAVLLATATAGLASIRGNLAFASEMSVYLVIVLIASLIGGFYPALATALAAGLLLNYYFAAPIHTFTIADSDNVVAVVVFFLVAVLVSRVVDVSARRLALAARASAEAETLSTLAASLLRGEDAVPALLGRVVETFGMRGASLLRRTPGEQWTLLETSGPDAPRDLAGADLRIDIDDSDVLALSGRPLAAEDQRVLSAFAAEVAVAYRQRQLAAVARTVDDLAESERARTALLNAVSHDLRTPIASAKTAVSSLRAVDVDWSAADRAELLANADEALDRLTLLVTNLLDLSRLNAGALPIRITPVGLDDVVAQALAHVTTGGARVDVDIAVDLPDVCADAGLLERVVANLVQNALRHAPSEHPLRITGSAHAGRVQLRVVDRGPGIPSAEVDGVFVPFRRRGDATSGDGVGLGLAIARGFTEAMEGSLTVEDTPGGGATFVVDLPAGGAS